MKIKNICIVLALFILTGCATKDFGKLPPLEPDVAEKMSCEDIEREFFKLSQYEEGVDEEATGGQLTQMMWGGIWAVMADEKLESIARKDIRNRLRLLYDLKVKKECD